MLLALCSVALAKPMPDVSLEEGVKVSPVIVVAKYRSFRAGKVDYFGGAKATYQLTSVLKGEAPSNGLLALNYAFHDGSACLEPQGWTFSAGMMPKVGSQWILLLQLPGTYRGDFGRLPATEANIKKVKALIGNQPAGKK